MSIKLNHGGPAFPSIVDHGDKVRVFTGMTLRDYFAGQAMTMIPYPQGVGLNEYVGQPFTEYAKNMAAFSYRIADAMLAAREVKP